MQFRTVAFEGFSTRERRDTPVVPPPAILAEVNRKNAERRAARGMTTDADRRRKAQQVELLIQKERAAAWAREE